MTAPTPADVPGQGEVALTRALISDPVIGPELTTWIAEGVARRVLASSWLAERDAEVARRAWDEGYGSDEECGVPRENPYRREQP